MSDTNDKFAWLQPSVHRPSQYYRDSGSRSGELDRTDRRDVAGLTGVVLSFDMQDGKLPRPAHGTLADACQNRRNLTYPVVLAGEIRSEQGNAPIGAASYCELVQSDGLPSPPTVP